MTEFIEYSNLQFSIKFNENIDSEPKEERKANHFRILGEYNFYKKITYQNK